ncbi:2-oxo acid dehydrogenase subunit E2 [Vibrio lentus]|nr:2-oxo acid dehydrogenase subunit E2 [Vibrio lentus]
MGIAAIQLNGLVVPKVFKDGTRKVFTSYLKNYWLFLRKTASGKLTAADMQGGCFTISSLGGIGGTAFTPIVNAPEVGIPGI